MGSPKLPARTFPRAVAAALAAAASLAAASGCSGAARASDKQRVEAVVSRWIAAERAGDGSTWCAQLSAARLAKEAVLIFDATGKHYPCALMHSARPPNITRLDLYTRARREVTEGFRIERTTITHEKAVVAFSWLASSKPNPIITYAGDTREGNRWVATVALVREQGNWKIGRQ
jgi:hypothetical protein